MERGLDPDSISQASMNTAYQKSQRKKKPPKHEVLELEPQPGAPPPYNPGYTIPTPTLGEPTEPLSTVDALNKVSSHLGRLPGKHKRRFQCCMREGLFVALLVYIALNYAKDGYEVAAAKIDSIPYNQAVMGIIGIVLSGISTVIILLEYKFMKHHAKVQGAR